MQKFSGWEYLLIDVCNQWGGDKMLFEERIQWATEHLDELESLADEAECQPLYLKAVMALRKAQKGIPTGHLVELDACCSGLQVLSAITGCTSGAAMCGLVDPEIRADAYTTVTQLMTGVLQGQNITVDVSRKQAKEAVMTVLYGSKAKPVEIFGKDTPELAAFYEVVMTYAPGAWDALQESIKAWQPYSLQHSWIMPDGFHAKVKVMVKREVRIEVDELNT